MGKIDKDLLETYLKELGDRWPLDIQIVEEVEKELEEADTQYPHMKELNDTRRIIYKSKYIDRYKRDDKIKAVKWEGFNR